MSGQERTIFPTTSKVFINPNFNNKASLQGAQKQSNKMHVNPHFSEFKQYVPHPRKSQSNIASTKIFVNPNFMRSNSTRKIYPVPYNDMNNESKNNIIQIVRNAQVNYQQVEQFSQNINAIPSVSKSRYSLVRQTANKVSEIILPQNTTSTIKLNKYKSVPIQSVQNVVPKPSKISKTIKINKYKTISLNEIKNKTNNSGTWIRSALNEAPKPHIVAIKSKKVMVMNKMVNKRIIVSPKNTKNMKLIRNLSLNKSNTLNKSICQEKQKTPRVMKKNNIPCSLFRKYGKCLRASYGKCEYLHDKKHVSICRKFLKGVCHDNDCLLSHDLTSNKMPTCYFYLKGMCIKENCPYLHVKLNEKANICTDFLKGYCEKGDKCLHRHIHLCPEFAAKGFCSKKSCLYPHGSKKVKGSLQSRKKSNTVFSEKRTIQKNCGKDQRSSRNETNPSARYYRESTTERDNGESEVIKPKRCKLGTLPSFIHL